MWLARLPPDEGEPNAAECFVHNYYKYFVHVLVVLLHVRFSVVSPIPFYWPPFFSGSSLYRKYYHTSLLFLVCCNSQTTQATELIQTRLQIAPSILITFHIKKDT